MAITAKMVKALRDKTGAGMMDCKKALAETNGDVEAAVDFLRTKGLASASKKAGRAATEGLVSSYIHMGGKIGVLVEVNCETDFVARTDKFQNLVRDISMHIAAAAPEYVSEADVPADVLDREKEIFKQQAMEEGKPEQIAEKIVVGRVKKFYTRVCLLNQPYVKDDKMSVQDMLKAAINDTGENINIRRFARFVLGEGLEKKEDNLADEVAKMTQG